MNSLKDCFGTCKAGAEHRNAFFKSVLVLIVIIMMPGCGPGAYEKASYEERSKEVADSVSSYMNSIATDTINGITHNFIKNASIKLKAINVLETTQQIEKLVIEAGGYITQSDLESNIDYQTTVHSKKDSLADISYYTTTSNMSLRVPSEFLDTVIDSITDMAEFIDHRKRSASDVKTQLFSNLLAENRFKKYKTKLEKRAEKGDAKLQQYSNAEENLLEKQSLADTKRIETYELADKVNYSTIELIIYQDQCSITHIKPVQKEILPYEASFGEKLKDGLMNGFEVLKNIILFFANVWGLIVVLVLFVYLFIKAVNYFTGRPKSAKV